MSSKHNDVQSSILLNQSAKRKQDESQKLTQKSSVNKAQNNRWWLVSYIRQPKLDHIHKITSKL